MGDVRVSQMGAWVGGTVADIAACGDVALAATFAGLFRSTDDGHSWRPVGRNLPDWFIQAVAIASTGEQALGLAASHQGWLYFSPDGGETWETGSYWLDLGTITRLVASPCFEEDGIVFACTEEDGIFKSRDRGRNWKQASFGLLNLNVASLCFSPAFAQDEVVFAGTDGGGLFRSRNAGRAWRESGEGLPDSAVQCLGISPGFATDGTIWAGTEDQGLYCSTDGGRTWAPSGEALSQACINGLYVPPNWRTGGRIVAATDEGLLVSSDGGQSWEPTRSGPEYPYTVVRCQDGLLAGAYADGIYRSAEGTSWQASSVDLAAHVPPLVCFSDAFERDQTLWMASMEGVFARSVDAGQTWRVLYEDEEFAATSLAGVGAGESMMLLSALETRLVCSQDGGETWAPVLDTGDDPILAVSLSQTYDQDQMVLVGTAGGKVLRSRSGGASWEQMASCDGETVVALAGRTVQGASLTYAVTARQVAGGEWQLALRDAEGGQPLFTSETSDPVSQLCPFDGDKLLCSMGARVMYLAGGQLVLEAELEGETSVSCLAIAGDAMLAGTRQAVYRSADAGQTWSCLTADVGVLSLHVASPNRVYGASMGGQLWCLDLPSA
jgi:photosystem II stability/assembly factor-like uncharacterized protein